MNKTLTNRRRFERFPLPAMYTSVVVRPVAGGPALEGHSYDVSEGGAQVELDERIAAGTAVTISMTLPYAAPSVVGDSELERTVTATGNIVWMDDSEPGPARMAIAFTKFAAEGDRDRLLRQLSTRRGLRAA